MSKPRKTRKLVCQVTGKPLMAAAEYYAKKLSKYDGDESIPCFYFNGLSTLSISSIPIILQKWDIFSFAKFIHRNSKLIRNYYGFA